MKKFLHHVIFEEILRWHWSLIRIRRSEGGVTPTFGFLVFDWTTDGYWDINGFWLIGFGFMGRHVHIIEGIDND